MNFWHLFLPFFALTLTLTTPAQAEPPPLKTYTYRVRIPASALSCAESALQWGHKIANSTGVVLLKSECQGTVRVPADPRFNLYIHLLTYQAPREIMPIRTSIGTPDSYKGTPTDWQGYYTQYAECLQDLNTQVALYEAQTGRTTATVYCEHARSPQKISFVLNIESFGLPLKTLFAFQAFQNPDAAGETQVRQLLQSKRAVIAKQTEGAFLYYATHRLPVESHPLALFLNQSQCTQQLPFVQDLFVNLASAHTIARCFPSVYNSKAYTLTVVSYDANTYSNDYGHNGVSYSSFAECQQDRSRRLRQEKLRDYDVLGGLCIPDIGGHADQYVLDIFMKL